MRMNQPSIVCAVVLLSPLLLGLDAPFLWLGGGHNAETLSVAWSPDGQIIATGSGFIDGTCKLWDAESGQLMRTLKANSRHSAHVPIYFSPDGNLIASVPEGIEINVWRVSDGVQVQNLPGTRWFAFSPDSASIASARNNGAVVVNRISDGAQTLTMAGHNGPALGIAYAPSGTMIASIGEDGLAKLWSTLDGSSIGVLNAHPAGSFQSRVAFSPDESLFATSDDSGDVKLWRVSDHTLARTLSAFGTTMDLLFTPDGSRLATVGIAGQVAVWRVSDGALLITIPQPSSAYAAAFSPTTEIAVAGGEQARIFDVASGMERLVIGNHRANVTGVALNIGASVLASASHDGTIRLWNITDGTTVGSWDAQSGLVFAMTLNPAGELLASAGSGAVVNLWRTSDGQLVRSLPAQSFGVHGLAFSPTGDLLVSTGSDASAPIRVWRVSDGAIIDAFASHNNNANAVTFSPDGSLFITGGADHSVRIWRTLDRSPVATLVGHADDVLVVAASGDGEYVASGDADGVIKLWRLADGALLRTLSGHALNTRALAFAPDSEVLISGGIDETVRFWRVADGALIHTLDRETGGALNTDGGVLALSISQDGQLLVYGRDDATVVLADLCSISAIAPPSCISAPIPAANAWGLLCMALAIAGGGGIISRRLRHQAEAQAWGNAAACGGLIERTFDC